MIGICSACGNVADLKDDLCCICRMEKEIDESKGVKVGEAVEKGFRKLTGLQKEASVTVKEDLE